MPKLYQNADSKLIKSIVCPMFRAVARCGCAPGKIEMLRPPHYQNFGGCKRNLCLICAPLTMQIYASLPKKCNICALL